ncbi:uncharacterized protein C8orf88 isoform X2 [Salmo salar]|uniref:Uncharacterized protein C8orf88 isoform X2 n=1 Tax=Salmo salar TaxID=8030 RepID=A0ABM3EVU6_SALSA|nr:uncharacterized protein C8orf88-like isoform X2 [Salmo salar]
MGRNPCVAEHTGSGWRCQGGGSYRSTCSQPDHCGAAALTRINSIGVEQFFEILHLQTQTLQKDSTPTKVRISYTRDFLIQLASSPIAKRKPDFLPEHPVVLEKAREPGVPRLEKRSDENNEMFA